MTRFNIDGERMLSDLRKLRTFGECGKGVKRRAFTDADIQARRWLASRMTEAGLTVHVDPVGNVFGIPEGATNSILVGSHSDTQPEGGWLDGALGVIVGLEIARASREAGGPPIACVSFQDEEGRFSTLTGSRAWTGVLSLADVDLLADSDGVRFEEERKKASLIGTVSEVPTDWFRSFLELHIEQGPILDTSGERIGVVRDIVGIRGERMSFIGEQNHAGTTPMNLRRDAFQGLVRFTTDLNSKLRGIAGPATVWTIGHVAVHPNAASVIPGRVDFSVQWRDPSDELLQRMREVVHQTALATAEAMRLEWTTSDYSAIPATHCDPTIVAALERAAVTAVPNGWRPITSGALHDAANVSKLMPMGMLFVPSINGISHNFDEDTAVDDLVLGAETLARAINLLTN
ncbi:hydantoinase/carbamoylase family amidase [Shinella curvata]|uniref:Hydantoinase/carbamoylase family amidase n=1 Tax=Shinella curvata TaxID=1817964 RepID=A0ABT8XB77_9HYPH|nr:hydantoinase/carbamoylase family amidase [Shinella curvata]MCJ8054616.1 hydantoinase/carbamoylase family amidase [Shinella curvata]MDO6120989.1 hydantoinase/carbamoylase family amidase [Shinella curvata]